MPGHALAHFGASLHQDCLRQLFPCPLNWMQLSEDSSQTPAGISTVCLLLIGFVLEKDASGWVA